MRKCSVCGRRFRLLAKNRYEVVKSPVGFNCLTQGTVYYNAFNCPHCGCQNIVGVLEKVNVRDTEEQPQETKEAKKDDDQLEGQMSITKQLEEIAGEICSKYCKYSEQWDEEKGGDLSESDICRDCLLSRL